MMPKTTEHEPNRTNIRGLPTSKTGPQLIGDAQRKKEVSVPIHDIEELEFDVRSVPL